MSDVSSSRCDQCQRAVEDRYTEREWIHLDGLQHISISIDRRPDGQARTRFRSLPGNLVTPSQLDFCDSACLVKYFAEIPGPREP